MMHAEQIDPNTGFLDRSGSLQLVADMVKQMGDDQHSLTVIWIDLDRFKHLNASFGYDGGDSIISIVADRLRDKLLENAVVGRVGTDEFIYIVPDLDVMSAEKLGIDLLRAIEPPFVIVDFRIRITASIGIALLEPGESADELLERADWAKGSAKKQGGNRYVISGNELVPSHMGIIQAREELEVEYLLHTALDTGGLQLHYQPILDFQGNVISVEALMRCTVDGKNIPPARFFPVAEKSGLIVRLGEWSLLHGTLQARHLNQAGMYTTVSINISRGQLADSRFAQALHAAIILANIDPGLIELEFSESIFMDDSEIIQTNLRTSRDIGVGLAIDNFGTGFSCLATLKDIPAAKLKLGRTFTMGLSDDLRALAVVKATVQMGKDLGMIMIAEGVETKEQMEILRDLSVDGIQGYYYAKPMDVELLSSWLAEREH